MCKLWFVCYKLLTCIDNHLSLFPFSVPYKQCNEEMTNFEIAVCNLNCAIYYTPLQTKFWVYIGITLSVLSVIVHISCRLKLYTVVVYNLRMCMKEDNPGPNNIKGDKLREIIICAGQGVSFVI